jgi:antitoxin component YwqK of YwqJK toxin-antitoxin module
MFKNIYSRKCLVTFFAVLSLLSLGCDDEGVESKQNYQQPSIMENDENIIVNSRFISKDRNTVEILSDYEKPLVSYPAISSSESTSGEGGLVYRQGLEDPFTGRIIDRFDDGGVMMDSSYLNGLPHGIQIRYFESGNPALEATFDNGRLSGIKSRWWGNGLIREEEYWSEGNYRGRRLWDEAGRLIREEMLP